MPLSGRHQSKSLLAFRTRYRNMVHFLPLVPLILSIFRSAFAGSALSRESSSISPPNKIYHSPPASERIERRQITSIVSTCGYVDGDPERSRTADPGYGCRVDTANGLWGFCPTEVITPRDCGLAGYCVDRHFCTEGCGRLSRQADITTFTCESKEFCSTLLLVNGPDQSFEYIACGARFATDTLFAIPNEVEATTTPSTSPSLTSISGSSPTLSIASLATQPSSSPTSISSTPAAKSPSATSEASSSNRQTTNIGAIIGGVIGGITLVCLTVLGVFVIRRKRTAEHFAYSNPRYTRNSGSDTFVGHVELRDAYDQGHVQKPRQMGTVFEPAELVVREGNASPIELPVRGRD